MMDFGLGMGVKRVNFALHHAESPPKYIVVQSGHLLH